MDALQTKTKDTGHSSLEVISGSEILIRSLIAEGVDTLFGYPGGAIMPVYDALYGYTDTMTHILTRHEQGAIHAAQGYARASGRVGVAFATSGPGATNLITGLADALIDSTPLVCITGQVFSHLLGTDAFQEADVVNTTTPVTKWNIQVSEAKDIGSAVARAFHIAASGRPGPVVVDITKDAQAEKVAYEGYKRCAQVKTYLPMPALPVTQLARAAQLINQAKRPYIVAGQGVLLADAQEELIRFSEKTGIPVACTLLGLGAINNDHPNYVGFLGMHGNYAPNVNTNECDVLIAVGMRFDDRVTGNVSKYAKQAKVIHIDIDRAELNKIIKADVAIHGDAKESLAALLDMCDESSHNDWLNSFRTLEKVEHEKVIQPEIKPDNGQLTMAEVVHAVSEITEGNAIVVSDVGQHQMVAARYYGFKKPRTAITSGGAGTMGFALPAAIGAKLGCPKRTVVAVIGDGGFQMTIQELGTIMQYEIPVKIIVLNNSFLGMVRQWQQLFFDKRYSFTEMENPSFTDIVKAYKIPANKVEERTELLPAIKALLTSPGSGFLEVVVRKEDNVFPMVPAGAGVSEVLLELSIQPEKK